MIINKPTYWIAHNNKDVVHYGYKESGEVKSGQPEFETFDNEADYLKRLNELGINPKIE